MADARGEPRADPGTVRLTVVESLRRRGRCGRCLALEFLPRTLQRPPHLSDPGPRDVKPPGNLHRAMAYGQKLSDPTHAARQGLEPSGKIDPHLDHVGRSGVSILDHDFTPVILLVIEAVEPLHHYALPSATVW